MNKQKLIDIDNSIVVTRGKGDGGIVKYKGGQIYGDRQRFDLGGGHTVQYVHDMSN